MALTYRNFTDRPGYREEENDPSLSERLKSSMTVLKALKLLATTITALASVWTLVQGVI